MKRIIGSIIPIIAIVALLFGLAVIPPTEAEAAFESQVTTAGVAVVPDPAQIDIERGYVFSEPFSVEMTVDLGESSGSSDPGLITVTAWQIEGPGDSTDNLRFLRVIDDTIVANGERSAAITGIDVTDTIWTASLMLTDDIDTSGIDRGGGYSLTTEGSSFDDPVLDPGGGFHFVITEISGTETTQDASLAINELAATKSATMAQYDVDEQSRTKIPITLGILGGLAALFGFGALAISRRATFAPIVESTGTFFGRLMHLRARGA